MTISPTLDAIAVAPTKARLHQLRLNVVGGINRLNRVKRRYMTDPDRQEAVRESASLHKLTRRAARKTVHGMKWKDAISALLKKHEVKP